MRIHFICRGNVYRSMMAEAYCNSLQLPDVNAISSGTVAEANRVANEACLTQTADILTKRGLGTYVKHRADQLTQERIDGSDVVVCMNQQIRDECQKLVRLPEHTIIWDVGDWTDEAVPPTTLEAQIAHTERTFSRLKEEVDKLVTSRGRLKLNRHNLAARNETDGSKTQSSIEPLRTQVINIYAKP